MNEIFRLHRRGKTIDRTQITEHKFMQIVVLFVLKETIISLRQV